MHEYIHFPYSMRLNNVGLRSRQPSALGARLADLQRGSSLGAPAGGIPPPFSSNNPPRGSESRTSHSNISQPPKQLPARLTKTQTSAQTLCVLHENPGSKMTAGSVLVLVPGVPCIKPFQRLVSRWDLETFCYTKLFTAQPSAMRWDVCFLSEINNVSGLISYIIPADYRSPKPNPTKIGTDTVHRKIRQISSISPHVTPP